LTAYPASTRGIFAQRASLGLPIGGLDEGPGSSALYRELVAALAPLNLSYLHLMYAGSDELLAEIRSAWPPRLMVLRLGRMRETLDQDIVSSLADMISIGRWALANPDFVERLRANASFNDADRATFYGGDTAGYTDYPRLHD
jgi:2,4-dienoyl-CoA reductase-like NADH-dependent reductase (Old Yellow Enzyme family)